MSPGLFHVYSFLTGFWNHVFTMINFFSWQNCISRSPLGIADTHWTEGKIIQENHTMIYSGREKREASENCNEEQCSKINDGILGNFR